MYAYVYNTYEIPIVKCLYKHIFKVCIWLFFYMVLHVMTIYVNDI